jgi:aminopeptidase N
VVYDKAAYVLHMLRGVVGDEAFFRGLVAYLQEHAYGKATTDDFRGALETASGMSLEAYVLAWVQGTGLPRLAYTYRAADEAGEHRLHLTIEATNLPGPVPVLVTVDLARGELTRVLQVGPEGARVQLVTPSRPRRVGLNADRALLARVSGS